MVVELHLCFVFHYNDLERLFPRRYSAIQLPIRWILDDCSHACYGSPWIHCSILHVLYFPKITPSHFWSDKLDRCCLLHFNRQVLVQTRDKLGISYRYSDSIFSQCTFDNKKPCGRENKGSRRVEGITKIRGRDRFDGRIKEIVTRLSPNSIHQVAL